MHGLHIYMSGFKAANRIFNHLYVVMWIQMIKRFNQLLRSNVLNAVQLF